MRPTKYKGVKNDEEDVMGGFPASHKVYVEGSQPTIRVPFREIEQTSTVTTRGEENNAPIRVYDTSGPYTDGDVTVNIEKGLPSVRRNWVIERGDAEEYLGREIKPETTGIKIKIVVKNLFFQDYKENHFERRKGKM